MMRNGSYRGLAGKARRTQYISRASRLYAQQQIADWQGAGQAYAARVDQRVGGDDRRIAARVQRIISAVNSQRAKKRSSAKLVSRMAASNVGSVRRIGGSSYGT